MREINPVVRQLEQASAAELRPSTVDAIAVLLEWPYLTDPQRKQLLRIRHAIACLPMSEVLERVPGRTVVDRAKAIGIARQTYYQWLRGVVTPNRAQARRLARLTNIPFSKIRFA